MILFKKMKKHLLGIAHIIALIGVYVTAYILSGQFTNLASGIPKEIDFLRIILGGIIVILIFYFGAKLYAEKVMRQNLSDFRIKMKKPDLFWVIVAIIMPSLVVLFYIVTGIAELKTGQSDTYHTIRYFTRVLFIGGITAAIMEEFFFRGFLLGYLEKKYGLLWAILIPSLLFGPPHLLNVENPSIALIVQFTLFALIFGIVVSLLVY
jgi:membrane protease YdiL (CAAX protease family)